MGVLDTVRNRVASWVGTETPTTQPSMLKSIIAFSMGSAAISRGILRNPDEALKHYAPGEQADQYYGRVRRQLGAVSGLVDLRIDAVMALPHTWLPGDPNDQESLDYCEGVRQAWNNGMIMRDVGLRAMMLAIPYGETYGELVYGPVDVAITAKITATNLEVTNPGSVVRIETWFVPVMIVDLPSSNFQWDRDLNLRFRTWNSDAVGDLVDPMKVIVARYGSVRPHGDAAMKYIVTDAWKLDWIDRRGLEALDKAGYPMAQVTVPMLWDEERVASTMAWADYTYKNYMIVRNGDRFEISFPDADARPTFIGADQVVRIKQIEDTMQGAYLGLPFSTNQKGAKASDQVRNEVRFEKTSGDSAVYDEMARQWEEKIYQINRPGMADYKRCRMRTDYQPTSDVATRANVYVQMGGIGFPLSKQQASEEFNLRQALHESDTFAKPTASSPASASQDAPGMNQNIDNPAQNDPAGTSSVKP